MSRDTCVSINVSTREFIFCRWVYFHAHSDALYGHRRNQKMPWGGESRMSWTRASLYFSRRLHHRNDYRLIFWLWENDYTAETIRDKPDWTYVKKNGTTTAQVVRLHDHPPPTTQLSGPLSMVRRLGGKSGETLKGFTGLRTLDSAQIGSRSTGETKCTLRRKKKVNENAMYIRSILRCQVKLPICIP